MKNTSRWSPVVPGLEPITAHLSAPMLTVWRRCVGFIEERHALDRRGSHEPAFRIGRWLSLAPPDLRLHFVLKVGGAQRSVAWLGLSVVGGAPRHERRLEQAAGDLAEALDTWSLFPDVPTAGPRYASHSLGLVPVGPARPTCNPACTPSVLTALHHLAKQRVVRALSIELRPGGTSPELLEEITAARDRLASVQAPARHPFFFLDPGLAEAERLYDDTERLWQAATACSFRIGLHGRPPGPILLDALLDALNDDLGQRSRFVSGLPALYTGRSGPALALIHALASGATEPVEHAPSRDRAPCPSCDDIPF